MKKFAATALVILVLASCAKKEEATTAYYAFGIPKAATVVDGAAPTAITSVSASSVATLGQCSVINSTASLLSCMNQIVFTTPVAGGFAGMYFKKFIDEMDTRVGGLENRFEATPTCLSATPVALSVTLPLSIHDDISIPMYGQCYETHTVPSGTLSQDMTIGKVLGDWYLMIRTMQSASDGNVFIGKIDENGTNIDVWSFAYSDDGLSLLRMYGNRSSNSFTYNFASTNSSGNDFEFLWLKRNDDNTYVTGRAPGQSDQTPGCLSSADFNTAGSSCTGLDLPESTDVPSAWINSGHITSSTTTAIANLMSVGILATGVESF